MIFKLSTTINELEKYHLPDTIEINTLEDLIAFYNSIEQQIPEDNYFHGLLLKRDLPGKPFGIEIYDFYRE